MDLYFPCEHFYVFILLLVSLAGVSWFANGCGDQVIEGEKKYDERNWLQPTEEGFSRLNEV